MQDVRAQCYSTIDHFNSVTFNSTCFNAGRHVFKSTSPSPYQKYEGTYTSEGELQALVDTSFTADEPLSDEPLSDEEEEDVIGIQPTHVTTPQSSSCAANIQTTSTEVTGYKFKTKLGRVLIDIVPDKDLVIRYDRTRAQLKAQRISNQAQKQTTLTTYKSISQKVKLELLRVYKHAMREANNFSASTTTYPEQIQCARHKANICKKVLQSEWKETPTI